MGKFCQKCGNELSDSAKFCSKCGSKYEEVGGEKIEAEQSGKRRIEQVADMASAGISRAGTVIADGVEKGKEKFNEYQNMSDKQKKEKAEQYVNTAKEKSKEFAGDVKNFKTLPKRRKRKVIFIICGIIAVFLVFSAIFGDSSSGVGKAEFQERFCDNIGVNYNPDEWAIDNSGSDSPYIIEGYYGNGGLSILLYLDGDEVAAAIVITDMSSTLTDIIAYNSYNFDEEFKWKCAAVSAMLGCDMNEADSIVREANRSDTPIEVENGITITPYVPAENLAGFAISTENFTN